MNAGTQSTESSNPREGPKPKGRGTKSQAAIWEAFVIAVDSIWSHKMRSILTLLGVIIGVASVIAVGGAIEGLGVYVKDRLVSTFGSNTFIVARLAGMNRSEEDWEKALKRNKKLYLDDLRAVDQRCEGCEAVVPLLRGQDDAKLGNRTFFDATVTGVSENMPKITDLEVDVGRFLSSFDVDHARSLAVIGADVRNELFGSVDPLGKEFKLGGDSFTVVGVEKSKGTFFGQSMDNNVYIPYSVYLKKYGSRQSINIRIKAPSAEVQEAVQDEVRVIMRSRHHLRPNQEDDFDILGSKTIQESVGQFTGAIAAVVTPITLISLVVGGIVIMNIMLVTVTERTKEVGMRKAVGARRRDIMLQFLIESALLASLGGGLGIGLGYIISIIIRSTTPIPMTITVGYILLSLAASGGIGIISGIYPAHKAAKLDPIVALSRE
jgi:putative ABC transport system permease protein